MGREIYYDLNNPYEYIKYNMINYELNELKGFFTLEELCACLRKFQMIDQYSVADWNSLFEYFCKEGLFVRPFETMEEIMNALSIRGVIAMLG